MGRIFRTRCHPNCFLKPFPAFELPVFNYDIMAADAWDRLLSAPLDRLAASDSIPVVEHLRCGVIRIPRLLAQAVRHLAAPQPENREKRLASGFEDPCLDIIHPYNRKDLELSGTTVEFEARLCPHHSPCQ